MRTKHRWLPIHNDRIQDDKCTWQYWHREFYRTELKSWTVTECVGVEERNLESI